MVPLDEPVPLEWGDDLEHLVVITGNSPLAGADHLPPPGSDGPTEATGSSDPRDPGIPTPAAVDGGMVTVRYLDGSQQQMLVPPNSLLAIPAVSWTERSLLDDPDVLLLVADPTGAIGPRGARYSRTELELVQYAGDGRGPTAGTDEPSDAPRAPPTPAAGSDEEIAAAIRTLPGVIEVISRGGGVLSVAVDDPAKAEGIAATPGVVSVEPDVLLRPGGEPFEHLQWAIENTGSAAQTGGQTTGIPGVDPGFPAAWTVSEGAGVVVAVIDTGVSATHADLVGQLWTNPDEVCGDETDHDGNGYAGDCRGWDFGDGNWDPGPRAGSVHSYHGNHVAGIVAAARNGVGIVGAAPAARVMALKVSDSSGRLVGASLAAAITYAVGNGADIINMSLGTDPNVPRSHAGAMEAAVSLARDAGVLIVASTGNQGVRLTDDDRSVWPAGFARHFDNVIAVGNHENRDTRHPSSNHGGPTTIYGPGSWIASLDADGQWMYSVGTSQASPHVAAAAALLIASGVATDPGEIRQRLVDTAVATPYGPRLDAAAAIGVDRAATGPVVEMAGTDTLAPDEQGRLAVRVRHHGADPVSQLRISVATRHEGRVYAVGGLRAVVDDGHGQLTAASTDAGGSFPTLELRDTDAVAGEGAELGLAMALPAGDYAVVAEPLSAGGIVVGPAWVGYVSVGSQGEHAPPPPGAPAPTQPPASATTTTTAAPAPPPDGPTTPPAPDTPTTTPPTDGPTTPAPDTPTTAPPTDGPTTPAPDTPTTTAPIGPPPPPSAPTPVTTTTTTTPSATTTTTSTTPAPIIPPGPPGPPGPPAPPGTTAPPSTTTPPPEPVVDGQWRLDGMSPRDATVSSGGRAVITGVLPTNIRVYAWFGDLAIVLGTVTPAGLEVMIPTVNEPGRVDVHVRFRTDEDYMLTLVDAFTFHPDGTTPPDGPPPPTTSPSPTAPVTTTTTTTTTPPATHPPSTQPAPDQPPPTQAPAPEIRRGELTLSPASSSSALGRLTVQSWPSVGCTGESCPTTRF